MQERGAGRTEEPRGPQPEPAVAPAGPGERVEVRREEIRLGPGVAGAAERPASPARRASERRTSRKSTKRAERSAGRKEEKKKEAAQKRVSRGEQKRRGKKEQKRIDQGNRETQIKAEQRRQRIEHIQELVSLDLPEEIKEELRGEMKALQEGRNVPKTKLTPGAVDAARIREGQARRPWRDRLGRRVGGFIPRRGRKEKADERTTVVEGRNGTLWKVATGVLAAALLFAVCGPEWGRRAGEVFPAGTPEPPRAGQATPTPGAAAGSPTPEPTRAPGATSRPGESGFQPGARATGGAENTYTINHPDMDGKTVDRQLPQGFTPDSRLVTAPDLTPRQINSNLSVYKDWEKALNTGRAKGDELAGYNYDYNDTSDNPDFRRNLQGDMEAWRIIQGQTVEVPGIGRLEGGPRRSVMVLFINLTQDVIAWDKDELGPVLVKRGFTATGRIFDGNKLAVTEENLTGHWSYRQGYGTPEKSYRGITDHPDNALYGCGSLRRLYKCLKQKLKL